MLALYLKLKWCTKCGIQLAAILVMEVRKENNKAWACVCLKCILLSMHLFAAWFVARVQHEVWAQLFLESPCFVFSRCTLWSDANFYILLLLGVRWSGVSCITFFFWIIDIVIGGVVPCVEGDLRKQPEQMQEKTALVHRSQFFTFRIMRSAYYSWW